MVVSPTKKEKKTLQLMAKGKTLNEAVATAYNTKNNRSANTIAYKLRRRKRFLAYLDKSGLTEELILKTLVEGMHADKVIVDKAGDEHISPHTMARIAAAKEALKLRHLDRWDEETSKDEKPLIVRSIRFDLNNHKISINDENTHNTPSIDGEIIDGSE